MKNTSLMICTSLAALALATGSAFAESERMGPGRSAGEGASRMEQGLEGRSMGAEGSGRMDRNMRTGERFDRGEGARSRPDVQPSRGSRSHDGMGATGTSEGDAGRDRMERGDRGDGMDRGERSERRGSDGDKAERRSRGNEGASEGDAGRDRSKTGERSKDARDRDGDRANRGSDRDGRDANRGERDADRGMEGRSGGADGKGKPAGSLTQLDTAQRTEAQSVFRSHESEALVRDVDFDVRVGVVVPGAISLFAVPAEVVVLVPDYRPYKYFIYDDQVVVVDPATMEIVDVMVLS